MDASATTITIQSPEVPPESQIRHNHGPNFGRYVADCPVCAKKFPEGPPVRTKKIRSRQAGTITVNASSDGPMPPPELSTEEMIERLRAAGIQVNMPETVNSVPSAIVGTVPAGGIDMDTLMAAMKVLGTELRRPDPEVEAERLAQKARLRFAKQQERVVIEEAEAQKKALQAACERLGHKQNQGRSQESAVSGQMCSDGLFHWLCVSCFATGTRKPRQEEMSMGVA